MSEHFIKLYTQGVVLSPTFYHIKEGDGNEKQAFVRFLFKEKVEEKTEEIAGNRGYPFVAFGDVAVRLFHLMQHKQEAVLTIDGYIQNYTAGCDVQGNTHYKMRFVMQDFNVVQKSNVVAEKTEAAFIAQAV